MFFLFYTHIPFCILRLWSDATRQGRIREWVNIRTRWKHVVRWEEERVLSPTTIITWLSCTCAQRQQPPGEVTIHGLFLSSCMGGYIFNVLVPNSGFMMVSISLFWVPVSWIWWNMENLEALLSCYWIRMRVTIDSIVTWWSDLYFIN